MSVSKIISAPSPFIGSSKKSAIPVHFFTAETFKKWLKKQPKSVKTQIEQNGFSASSNSFYDIKNNKAETEAILCGTQNPIYYLDGAGAAKFICDKFSKKFLNSHIFEIVSEHGDEDINKLCIGWGLAHYNFDSYKKIKSTNAALKWPSGVNKKLVNATIESISYLRNLVNTPANDLGTNELAKCASEIAKAHKAKVKITKGAELQKGFPMIHNVGKASPRPPQLVDMKWGKASHPKVTIIGKGIIYDTGGLNLKPGMYMRDMKKDMGGSAHALGLAHLIMSMKLPVQLRVLLPIAENSVAGNSYRPGDVLNSRKGITVEIGDTDAEGRLVVADALTYACEENPDLLIDFCTLTGAARVALGYDIPAFMTNQDEFVEPLRSDSVKNDDPIWPLPLWQGYKHELGSTVADMTNDGSGRAGAIHGGLFLERFIDSSVDWVHLDCYAWEQHGKAGRPKGGADTGMRAIFEFIKSRYT